MEEVQLVDKLRQSPDFIPALSIFAEKEGEVVGHILFLKLNSKSGTKHSLLGPGSDGHFAKVTVALK